MITTIDQYFLDGCMSCSYGDTPKCKVHQWTSVLKTLRSIILKNDLEESAKWGVPCYTYNKANVLNLCAFKDYFAISFFKGALLSDNKQVLVKPGPNSQSGRYLKFTQVEEVKENEQLIIEYINEAIENEKNGLKVAFKKTLDPLPQELIHKFDDDPIFKEAFYALTPGRQRGYILYFSQAKQSKTRVSRIEKYEGKILNGVGMHDHYKSKK